MTIAFLPCYRRTGNHKIMYALSSISLATDLSKDVTELSIPVYFFEGVYDYTCSYKLAKEYFDQLKAPTRGFLHVRTVRPQPII